jgi:hypothetical protein
MKKTKANSNYQDLLKVIALIAMLIDHLGCDIFTNSDSMRLIGRFAMPIFTFYAGYNFREKIRHSVWISGIVLVIVSKIIFVGMFTNILISIACGQFYLLYMANHIKRDNLASFLSFLLLIILTPFTHKILEFGSLAIAFMHIGYMVIHKIEARPHLLFATACLCILNQHFFLYSEILDFVLMLVSTWIAYLCLKHLKHKSAIPINVNIISRNMLYIYTFTSILIMGLGVYFRVKSG